MTRRARVSALALVLIVAGCGSSPTARRIPQQSDTATGAVPVAVHCGANPASEVVARTDSGAVRFGIGLHQTRQLRFPFADLFQWTNPASRDHGIVKVISTARCQDGAVVAVLYGEGTGRTTVEAQMNPSSSISMAPGYDWIAQVRVG